MANFRVGQKVVCVDDGLRHTRITPVNIVKGQVYIIRTIEECLFSDGPDIGVRLDGVFRPHSPTLPADMPYAADRFRPVAEKPTSMEIIKAIVLDPSKPIPADPSEPKLPAPVPEYVQGDRL